MLHTAKEMWPELYKDLLDWDIGPGWWDLVFDLSGQIMSYCAEYGLPIPQCVQIKEKFGGLRFYLKKWADPQINDMIMAAQAKSQTICDVCGSPGTLKTKGWWSTRCEEHK